MKIRFWKKKRRRRDPLVRYIDLRPLHLREETSNKSTSLSERWGLGRPKLKLVQ